MSRDAFGDILGQRRAIEILTGAIASGHVHHAWIFHGPVGVGKFTTALRLARALLTPGVTVVDSVVILPDDAGAGEFSHPDLHVVVKELARLSDDASVRSRKLISIPKEVIERWLLAPASLAATVSADSIATKVFIVDEAELLNSVSQNALLKTLEEPPPGTIIALATSSEDRLLPTIRSRCQRLAFGPLDESSMRSWVENSGLDVEPADVGALIELSRGSPGLFAQMREAEMAAWARRLEPMLESADRGVFTVEFGPALAELVEAWASGWVERHKEENPSKDAANKVGARRALDLLAQRARRRLWDAPAGAEPSLRALRAIDLIDGAQRSIASNVNIKLAMENLASQLAL